MSAASRPHRVRSKQTDEANTLLHSAIDMDQVIVAETELLEDSLDHSGRFGPQLKKIRTNAVRNAGATGSAARETGSRHCVKRI